jgi:hypothetical protein
MNLPDRRSQEASTATVNRPGAATSGEVCIYYGGQRYQTSTKHAGIFLRHALLVADRHETELVVLVHRDGVDMLLITAAMPLAVGGVDGLVLDRTVAGKTR